MDRDAFIARLNETAKPKIIPLDVDGWGPLFVRPPTVAEIEDQTAQREERKGPEKRRFAKAAARLLCHEDGSRLLDAENEDHIELLACQPWAMLHQVLDAADPARHTVTG